MQRSIGLLSVAAALALSCASTPHYQFKYAEKRASLPNGLRMVIIPDKTTPMVQVDVRYEVGSIEDPPGKAGLAHLVEHMMFQHRLFGPDKPPTFEIIPQIAVGFNAYTTFDKTHYFLISRKEDLEGLIRLEAARMNARCQGIPPEQFEREREVVRNEIRQRTGTPEGLVPQLLLDAAYPENHAYREMVGGNDAQLSSIRFEDVCEFMERYYTPDRATVVVTGNVDPEEVGKLVNFAFGGIERRTPAPRKEVVQLPPLSYKKIVHELDVERSQVHVLWRLPPKTSDEWPAAQTMMAVMAGKVAFFAEDWDFAASVGAFPFGGDLAPIYVLSLELYDHDDVDEALDYVWKATNGLHRGFEEGIFDRETKALAKADFVMGLESLAARADSVADQVQFNKKFDFGSTGEYLLEEMRKIEKLDGGEYRDFIKGALRKDNATVVVIKADKKGRKGDKRSGLRFSMKSHDVEKHPLIDPSEAKRPLPTPQTRSVLSDAERYTLGNGMAVLLMPYDGWPIVTAALMFDVGSAHEPPSSAGLAGVSARYLRPPRDASIWKTGVGFFGSADSDHTTFYASGVEIYLDVIIKGLERNVVAGEHNQESIERWQRLQKEAMDRLSYRQDVASRNALLSAIYGPDHPYTITGSPTRESLGAIGRDAAMDFKRKHYSARNATLVVAGKFDPARAKEIIAGSFGEWSGGHEDQPVPRAQRARSGPEYIGVVGRELPQMNVTIAYPAPAGVDGQEAARRVLTTMMNLRMAKIRTELGSTYGTYASRSVNVGPSAYVMGGSVDGMRAGESLKAMREKLDSLRRGENFDADFALARRTVLRQLLAESTESMALAGRLLNIAAYDLPSDFHDQMIKRVAAVSPAQIKALIDAELGPENEVIVCTADRATLTRAFEEAGITEVRYIEP